MEEKKELSYDERRVLERQQIKDDIERLNIILKEMGYTVNSKHDEFYRAYAHGTKENKELYLTANDYKTINKIQVSGMFPKDSRGNNFYNEIEQTDYSSINITMNKTNEKIIEEINKRFMPNYLGALNKVLERIKQNEDYFNKSNEAIDKASKILNLPIDTGYLNKIRYWNHKDKSEIISLDVEPQSHGGELYIKIRGKTESILKILEKVKEYIGNEQ